MLRRTLILCLLALGTLATFAAACGDETDGGNTGPTGGGNEREAFLREAEDRIASLRADLDRLRDDVAKGNASEEVKQQADRLDERINEAESELEQVRGASDDEWQALKDRLDETLKDAGNLADEISSGLGLN
jgi:TolA-binding protein